MLYLKIREKQRTALNLKAQQNECAGNYSTVSNFFFFSPLTHLTVYHTFASLSVYHCTNIDKIKVNIIIQNMTKRVQMDRVN